jgi:[ribosomal protein S18]-alanine N-acetyltransferase
MRKLGPRPARPGSSFDLRRMTADDLEEVMALQRAAFAHPWSLELFKRELTHDWSTIYLAEEHPTEAPTSKPELLGFIIFWLVHDELHVLNIATNPIQRRRGVARALLSRALDRGREHRCTLATLEVRRSNEAALQLYKSFGFRAVGVRPNYYVDEGEDAIVMVLDL